MVACPPTTHNHIYLPVKNLAARKDGLAGINDAALANFCIEQNGTGEFFIDNDPQGGPPKGLRIMASQNLVGKVGSENSPGVQFDLSRDVIKVTHLAKNAASGGSGAEQVKPKPPQRRLESQPLYKKRGDAPGAIMGKINKGLNTWDDLAARHPNTVETVKEITGVVLSIAGVLVTRKLVKR